MRFIQSAAFIFIILFCLLFIAGSLCVILYGYFTYLHVYTSKAVLIVDTLKYKDWNVYIYIMKIKDKNILNVLVSLLLLPRTWSM